MLTLFADSAYTGPIFRDGAANAMRSLVVKIVKRPDYANGFVVDPSVGSLSAPSPGSIAAAAPPRD